MVKWLKSAPESFEIAVILSVAFGWFIAASTVSMFSPGSEPHVIGNQDLWKLLILELLLGCIALSILYLRGKRPKNYGLQVSIQLTIQGIVLCVLSIVLFFVVVTVVIAIFGDPADDSIRLDPELALLPALLLVLVNPLFEEFFAVGYLFTSLRDRCGKATLLMGSVALRVSYHTYQGRGGMLFAASLGFLFGLAYLWNRQLWPLFVGHALLDGIGLMEV